MTAEHRSVQLTQNVANYVLRRSANHASHFTAKSTRNHLKLTSTQRTSERVPEAFSILEILAILRKTDLTVHGVPATTFDQRKRSR
jgi:hypothetical protein